jgi:hypothetical protein
VTLRDTSALSVLGFAGGRLLELAELTGAGDTRYRPRSCPTQQQTEASASSLVFSSLKT